MGLLLEDCNALFEAIQEPEQLDTVDRYLEQEYFGPSGRKVVRVSEIGGEYNVVYWAGIRIPPAWTEAEQRSLERYLQGEDWSFNAGMVIWVNISVPKGGSFCKALDEIRQRNSFVGIYGAVYEELSAKNGEPEEAALCPGGTFNSTDELFAAYDKFRIQTHAAEKPSVEAFVGQMKARYGAIKIKAAIEAKRQTEKEKMTMEQFEAAIIQMGFVQQRVGQGAI